VTAIGHIRSFSLFRLISGSHFIIEFSQAEVRNLSLSASVSDEHHTAKLHEVFFCDDFADEKYANPVMLHCTSASLVYQFYKRFLLTTKAFTVINIVFKTVTVLRISTATCKLHVGYRVALFA